MSVAHAVQGLSESEVLARRQRGQGNNLQFQATRSYLQILRKNAFTFINTVLFAISIGLILMGQFGDALVTAGLVLLNVIVGVFQEGRAKYRLEQIALLTRPRASVIRDGQPRTVDPGEIVLGDVLRVQPGDQIVVDGQIIGDGRIEVDESLLTGESEHILKRAGDAVYSGSFCVSGAALYEAQRVGAESMVNRLTTGARAFRQTKTPLQADIDYIIRILVLLAAQLGILLGISFVMQGMPLVEWVRVAAVLVALVPQGLFFMTTVAYAMGAVRVAGQGALVQETNAVESMSHVNLLCLDKTGTLTSNRIILEHVQAVPTQGQEYERVALADILGDYAASSSGGTRTSAAIREALGGVIRPLAEEVAFDSSRKWSALTFADSSRPRTYVLGAPEILMPWLQPAPDLNPQIEAWTSAGLRVLLFAHYPSRVPLHAADGAAQLAVGLFPLALLSFRDELRAEAQETVRHFADLGIGLKIISGDNPQTVAALATQAGLGRNLQVASGLELQTMDSPQRERAIAKTSVFGRITPEQKEELVRLFRQQGHYVAMIGDGVNDVLSLKRAQVGIAMQSGSHAARSVADVVLLGDSFAALPVAFREGQRIVKGMEDVVRLLLTRTLYVLLLVIATRIVGLPFPVTPKHNSLLALLTVGIPILAIAAWARAGMPPQSVIRSTSHFVLPAAFSISVVALATYIGYLGTTGDLEIARTALTTVSVFCGLILVVFVEPPTDFWVGGDALSGDRRPSILALGMLALYGLVASIPALRSFFELRLLRGLDYLLMAILAAAWGLLLRMTWRTRLLERLLQPRGRV